MIELFQVRTVMTALLGHKDVQIAWFITFRRKPVVPYGNAIADYNPSDKWARYAKSRVDEFFTADEADWFVDFLKAQKHFPEGSTYINKAELPISNQSMGLRAIPIGGGPDHVSFHRGNYWLPVTGYYDLRHYDPLPDRRSELARRRRSAYNRFHLELVKGRMVCDADLEEFMVRQ